MSQVLIKVLTSALVVVLSSTTLAAPLPLQFAIPEIKIVKEVPPKTRDFSYIIPGNFKTYIYTQEDKYYKSYQRSYFAVTRCKGGWDCMRHYEILANGCIPYFIDIDKCNPGTMVMLPKELLKEAMNLPGVSYLKIDHKKFNKAKYYEILNKLLAHTRKYLTTQKMAAHVLQTINYSGTGKILFLSDDPYTDYMRCTILTGLKECLGVRVVDVPKIEHIYTSYAGDVKELYGKGFSYTKIVEDLPVDRDNIEQRIKDKEFDLVIYGSVHRGLRHYSLVCDTYEPEKIIYLCGEDGHQCEYSHLHNLFLREFDAYQP